MSKQNIFEVTNISDLKNILKNNLTVVIGLVLKDTSGLLKVIIRRFLKRKSESFPLLTFVYMDVLDEHIEHLHKMFKCVKEDYPKIFHIRDSVNILVDVFNADEVKIYESFAAVEPYYLNEMVENNNSNNINNNSNNDNNNNSNNDNIKNNLNNSNNDDIKNNEKFKLLEEVRENIYNTFTQNIMERVKNEKTQQ
jgi:hypothetical protein